MVLPLPLPLPSPLVPPFPPHRTDREEDPAADEWLDVLLRTGVIGLNKDVVYE